VLGGLPVFSWSYLLKSSLTSPETNLFPGMAKPDAQYCVFIMVQYGGKRRRRKKRKEIPNNVVTLNRTTAIWQINFFFLCKS